MRASFKPANSVGFRADADTPYISEAPDARSITGRVVRLGMHAVGYSMFAPVPTVHQTNSALGTEHLHQHYECHRVCKHTRLADPRERPTNSHPAELSFMEGQLTGFRAIALPGVAAWAVIVIAAIIGVAGIRGERHARLFAGLVTAIAFHMALHTIFGDDFFLYSPHWMPLLIGAVALATKPWWLTSWLNWAVGVAVAFMLINQTLFVLTLWSQFSSQTL